MKASCPRVGMKLGEEIAERESGEHDLKRFRYVCGNLLNWRGMFPIAKSA